MSFYQILKKIILVHL